MPGQGGSGFRTDLEPEELRTAVERALSQSREMGPAGLVWGPQAREGFRFGTLSDETPREGGPLAWALRAMIAFYYIEHDNRSATLEEVSGWIEAMSPAQVVSAVNVAVVVGLP